MFEGVIVGAIVAFAAAFAVWALLPAALRLHSAQRFAAWARGARRPGWVVRAASVLEHAARSRIGGCSDCSAAQPPGTSPEDTPKR